MTEEEIQKAVIGILVDDFECDREKITPEVNLFADLDLDSIDAIDLVVRLQQVTKKRVDPDDFRQIRTLRDVVQAVHKLMNEPTAATPLGEAASRRFTNATLPLGEAASRRFTNATLPPGEAASRRFE